MTRADRMLSQVKRWPGSLCGPGKLSLSLISIYNYYRSCWRSSALDCAAIRRLSQHGQNAGAAAAQAALPRLRSSSQRSIVRSLQTSAPAAAEVVVPAMGDSITEGSIAAVLKQPGGLSCACFGQLGILRLQSPGFGICSYSCDRAD